MNDCTNLRCDGTRFCDYCHGPGEEEMTDMKNDTCRQEACWNGKHYVGDAVAPCPLKDKDSE